MSGDKQCNQGIVIMYAEGVDQGRCTNVHFKLPKTFSCLKFQCFPSGSMSFWWMHMFVCLVLLEYLLCVLLAGNNLFFSFWLRFDVILVLLHLLPGSIESLCLDEVNCLVHCSRLFFPFRSGRAEKKFWSISCSNVCPQNAIMWADSLVSVTLQRVWRDQGPSTGHSGQGRARTESWRFLLTVEGSACRSRFARPQNCVAIHCPENCFRRRTLSCPARPCLLGPTVRLRGIQRPCQGAPWEGGGRGRCRCLPPRWPVSCFVAQEGQGSERRVDEAQASVFDLLKEASLCCCCLPPMTWS